MASGCAQQCCERVGMEIQTMKRLAPIVFLAATVPGIAPAVEWGLPWFHTRPKPVYVDDHAERPVSQKLVKRTESRTPAVDETSRPWWSEAVRLRESQKRDASSKASRISATGLIR